MIARRDLAGAEIREGARAYLHGLDNDAAAHLRAAAALLEGHARGLP